jgi:hypothetical protein
MYVNVTLRRVRATIVVVVGGGIIITYSDNCL